MQPPATLAPQSNGDEIAHSHVPLVFLLGRRASEYSLPSLRPSSNSNPPGVTAGTRSHQAGGRSSVLCDTAHIRQRERHARELLARVLARESRLDAVHKSDTDAALAPPRVRVSTADRHKRASELQRVLLDQQASDGQQREQGFHGGDDDNTTTSVRLVVSACPPRDHFAQFHGFAPREHDFVEVVGRPERIRRAQSVRQLHDDDTRRQIQQLHSKQLQREALRRQLTQQQSETKRKLAQAARTLAMGPPRPEQLQEDGREGEGENSSKHTNKKENKMSEAKQDAAKRLQKQQRDEAEKVRLAQMQELLARHESVQRGRQEREVARSQRLASHELGKKISVGSHSVGPSFLSALRMENLPPHPATTTSDGTSNSVGNSHSTSLSSLTLGLPVADEEDAAERNGGVHRTPAARLQARQHDQFVRSQLRRLQFGGGFGSMPRPSHHDHDQDHQQQQQVHENGDTLATHATGVQLLHSKRAALQEWKATAAHHQPRDPQYRR